MPFDDEATMARNEEAADEADDESEQMTIDELAAHVLTQGVAALAMSGQIDGINRLLDKLTQAVEALTTLVDQQQDRLEAQERMITCFGNELDRLTTAQGRLGTMLLEVAKQVDGEQTRWSLRR